MASDASSGTSGTGGSTHSSGSTTEPLGADTTLDPTSTSSTSAAVDESSSGEPPAPCSMLDVLFVIDNSGSMQPEQGRLLDAFDEFLDGLAATTFSDLHIMVVDTDAWPLETCPPLCRQGPCFDERGQCSISTPNCLQQCLTLEACIEAGFVCDEAPRECDQALGAGVLRTYGDTSSNQECVLASGARYIDSSEPDIEAAFECIARVGVQSLALTEQPMGAMVQAVSMGTPAAACNAGFLRDEASLLVVFATDESDDPRDSSGVPAGWRQALIAAKNGDASSIAMLGLFGDNDLADAVCQDIDEEAEAAPRLRELVDSFGDLGLARSICANDYGPFLAEAAALAPLTCSKGR